MRRVLAGGLLLAAAGAAVANIGPARRVDARLGDQVRRPRGRGLDMAAVATTDLGSLYAVAGCTTVLAASGRWAAARDVAVMGAGGWVAAQAAKPLSDRRRPYEAEGIARLIHPPTGSSYPSGHAAVATAVGAVVAARTAGPAKAAFALMGPYVAWSRVRVGVHYPSDAVGGIGLGLVLAAGWRAITGRLGHRSSPPGSDRCNPIRPFRSAAAS